MTQSGLEEGARHMPDMPTTFAPNPAARMGSLARHTAIARALDDARERAVERAVIA